MISQVLTIFGFQYLSKFHLHEIIGLTVNPTIHVNHTNRGTRTTGLTGNAGTHARKFFRASERSILGLRIEPLIGGLLDRPSLHRERRTGGGEDRGPTGN